MKKAVLLPLLFWLCASTLTAQWGVETDPKTGKKGLVHPTTGVVLIPFEYDDIQSQDTFVRVRIGKRTGLFTESGRRIAPVEYDAIEVGAQLGTPAGFVGVKKNGQLGLMNLSGKLVLPVRYEYVRAVFADLLVGRVAGDSTMQFFDARGKSLFQANGTTAWPGFDQNTVEIIKADRSRYFVDKKGQRVFPDRFIGPIWTDGKLVICANISEKGVWGPMGILSWAGDTILPCRYFSVSSLGGGRFRVKESEQNMGVVDEQGRFLIPISAGLITRLGDQPGDAFFKRTHSNSTGSIFDASGKLLLSDCQTRNVGTEYDFIGKAPDQRPARYFVASIENGKKTGLFHADGRQIVPPQYEFLHYCSDKHPIRAYANKTHSALDFNGKVVLPAQYSGMDFTENPRIVIARPDTSKLWGFIHLDKPEATRFEYNNISRLNALYHVAVKGSSYYLHDPEGKRINPEGFGFIGRPERAHYSAFREKKIRGQLIAHGRRKGAAPFEGPWVGFDETGKAWDFDPLPAQPEEVVAMVAMEEVFEVAAPRPEPKPAVDEVFQVVEKQPTFPGGASELSKYLSGNLKYPALAKENGVQGKVVLSFIVEKDGSLSDVQMLRDIGAGCGKEALRLVQAMPKWIPGEQRGQKVRVKYTLPVEFRL